MYLIAIGTGVTWNKRNFRVRVMVFNATFNNISVILWQLELQGKFVTHSSFFHVLKWFFYFKYQNYFKYESFL
jgi:hypothetical protein